MENGTIIIGFTDSVNECDCCGKIDLKGTYCIDLNGIELYYGSVCAFKSHALTIEEQKELKKQFKATQKNKKLYELHIAPLKEQLKNKLENSFTATYENLTDVAKKCYNQIEANYNIVIQSKINKYKISIKGI